MDNAQGYGYKSIQNAYKCFGYKTKHKNPKKYSKKVKEQVKKFIKKHNDVFDELSDMMFYSFKEGEDFSDDNIKGFLKEKGIELPFSFSELKRYF